MHCFHTAPWKCWPAGSSLDSVRGMQAVDGPDSSQLEWHQDGGRTASESEEIA
jgi:hypothetical protein